MLSVQEAKVSQSEQHFSLSSLSGTLLPFHLGKDPGGGPLLLQKERAGPAEGPLQRGDQAEALGAASCDPHPISALCTHCLPFWQLAALVSHGKVCQSEGTTWRLPGQPLPVFSGGNCGRWCVAAGLVGTRDMFKKEFPPPITEAGRELQECLRERLGMSIPREAGDPEKLGKRE